MAERPSTSGIRSKQKGTLRYIISTDVDTAARDFGVSTDAIKRFVNAKPETVKRSDRFNKLRKVDPVEVAKAKQVKLIEPLSGKKLNKAYRTYRGNPTKTKQVRFAQATREKRTVENGQVVYRPVNPTKHKVARRQILNNLGGMSAGAIIEQYQEGILSEDEARSLMQELFDNSDATGAQEYFDDHA